MIWVNVFFVSLVVSLSYSINNNNLIALVHIFRHGERVPNLFYKNDPYKNHWQNLKNGELTNEGRRQLYDLGQFIRVRYSDWIPAKYKKNFIYAQTTDSDRTHMSGQVYLYGLFPATGNQIWLQNTTWQPIPLHPSDPRVVIRHPIECPNYNRLSRQLHVTDNYFGNVKEKYSELFNYLSKLTGENITDVGSLFYIYDCLKIEERVGLTLPNWTKTVYPEPLRTLSNYELKSITYTTQLKRLFIGTQLNEIVTYFENMAVNDSSYARMQVYSSHDVNIGSILNSFGNFDPPYFPEFGASILLELRNNSNGPYINAWNKDGDNITQICINGCKMDCPLEEVRTRLSDIIIDVKTWTEECFSSSSFKVFYSHWILLFFCLLQVTFSVSLFKYF